MGRVAFLFLSSALQQCVRGFKEDWEGGVAKGQEETSGVMGMFIMLNVVMVAGMDTFAQSHQTVHL